MGRKGRVAGTRELAGFPFSSLIGGQKDAIEAVAIIHGARHWPHCF